MTQELPITRADTITVSAEAEEEVEATHADIHVTVRGTSLVSGDTALRKAREVATLVATLAGIGIEESSIELRDIRAEVTTKALGNKTSSATYSLRIANIPLVKIPDAVGVITEQKNADLIATVWQYGDDETIRLRLLETALRRVRTKATLIAKSLSSSILGVHSFTETFTDDVSPHRLQQPTFELMKEILPRVSSAELGLAVTHRKKLSQSVVIEFRVSAFVEE